MQGDPACLFIPAHWETELYPKRMRSSPADCGSRQEAIRRPARMSNGFGAATDCPSYGYPRVTACGARSEVNVFIRRRIRDRKWRIFAAGLAAFVFVFCGSVLSRAAVAAETNSAASADAPSLDTATPDPTPFTGNPEIKARLDAPGK